MLRGVGGSLHGHLSMGSFCRDFVNSRVFFPEAKALDNDFVDMQETLFARHRN